MKGTCFIIVAVLLALSLAVVTNAFSLRDLKHDKCPQEQPPVIGCKERQSGAELKKCVEALIVHGKAAQVVMDDMLDSDCFGFKPLNIKKPMKDVEKDCTKCVKILGSGFIDKVLKKKYAPKLNVADKTRISLDIHTGKAKGVERAVMKSSCKYSGTALKLKDIARASVAAETSLGLVLAMALADKKSDEGVCKTKKHGTVKWGFVGMKNRFKLVDDAYAAGYHDILTNVQLKGIEKGSKGIVGHIMELQFHHKFFHDLKTSKGKDGLSGHDYYNVIRILDERRMCVQDKKWAGCDKRCPCTDKDCAVWLKMANTPKVAKSSFDILKKVTKKLACTAKGKECTMSAKDIESNYGKPGSESALTEIMHGSRIFYQEGAKFPMGLYNELTETRLKNIKCK